jgi:hypothetical protein
VLPAWPGAGHWQVTQIDEMYEKKKAYSDGVTQKAAAHQLGHWQVSSKCLQTLCPVPCAFKLPSFSLLLLQIMLPSVVAMVP